MGIESAVVLLSGGLDSTVNLYEAKRHANVVLALTFDYGQRAARREIERSSAIAEHARVSHKVIKLNWFSEFTKTSLLNTQQEVPIGAQVSIDDLNVSNQTAKAVWVPNRNGIFLNIGAAFAEGYGAKWVVPGFNIEEGATFPDNTEGYLQALNQSFRLSTANQVEAKCFTTALNKSEIVGLGKKLGAPFELMWPCYFAGQKICGECESCQRFTRAMRAAGGDEK